MNEIIVLQIMLDKMNFMDGFSQILSLSLCHPQFSFSLEEKESGPRSRKGNCNFHAYQGISSH